MPDLVTTPSTDPVPGGDARARVARIRGGDARPGAARARRPRRSCFRPGRRAATWCATSSGTCPADRHRRARPAAARASGWTSSAGGSQTGGRAVCRALPGVCLRGQRAHVVPRRQPRLLERHRLFFHVAGELARPCRVTVVPPPRAGWRVATALPPVAGARSTLRGGRLRRAGRRAVRDRHARDARVQGRAYRFELALYGRRNADVARLVDILRRIVTATGRMFGGFPFDRYLFIVHALPIGSGGLEHRASVTMDIAGLSFEDEAGYRRFADLAAHEYFHAWNVKRIQDAALGPRRLHARELHPPALAVRGLHRLPRPHHHAARRTSHAIATSTGCSPRTGRNTRRARAATRHRSTSCRTRPGSSNTSRRRISSTARSATTSAASGPAWRWISSCDWRPRDGAVCPRCSAGCGSASAGAGARSTRRTCATRPRRSGAGASIASSTAPSAAPTSWTCRRCGGARASR